MTGAAVPRVASDTQEVMRSLKELSRLVRLASGSGDITVELPGVMYARVLVSLRDTCVFVREAEDSDVLRFTTSYGTVRIRPADSAVLKRGIMGGGT